jgi:hypothetical protein
VLWGDYYATTAMAPFYDAYCLSYEPVPIGDVLVARCVFKTPPEESPQLADFQTTSGQLFDADDTQLPGFDASDVGVSSISRILE